MGPGHIGAQLAGAGALEHQQQGSNQPGAPTAALAPLRTLLDAAETGAAFNQASAQVSGPVSHCDASASAPAGVAEPGDRSPV